MHEISFNGPTPGKLTGDPSIALRIDSKSVGLLCTSGMPATKAVAAIIGIESPPCQAVMEGVCKLMRTARWSGRIRQQRHDFTTDHSHGCVDRVDRPYFTKRTQIGHPGRLNANLIVSVGSSPQKTVAASSFQNGYGRYMNRM